MSAPPPLVAVVDSQPGDEERLARLVATVPTAVSHGPCDADEIVRRAAEASVLATLYTYTTINEDVLDRLPLLRLVITRTAGHSHIDVAAAHRRGITVATVGDAPTDAVAEYAIGALLALRRHIVDAVSSTGQGEWGFTGFRGREVRGTTLGVVGLGRIGARVAELANGMGMLVLGWSRTAKTLPDVEQLPLDDLLRRSSAISVNVALSPQTDGLLNAERLGLLPRGAELVNTARGEVVDLEALCGLLRSGDIGGACLDVLAGEPVASESLYRLADVPNLLITPHVSWHTHETLQRQFDGLTDQVIAFTTGAPIAAVSPSAAPEEPV